MPQKYIVKIEVSDYPSEKNYMSLQSVIESHDLRTDKVPTIDLAKEYFLACLLRDCGQMRIDAIEQDYKFFFDLVRLSKLPT